MGQARLVESTKEAAKVSIWELVVEVIKAAELAPMVIAFPPGEDHLKDAPEVVTADPALMAVTSTQRLPPSPPMPGFPTGVMLTAAAVVAVNEPILIGF